MIWVKAKHRNILKKLDTIEKTTVGNIVSKCFFTMLINAQNVTERTSRKVNGTN